MNPAASTHNFGGEKIAVPALRDVLNGRGKGVQRHLGNVHYRKLIYLNKVFYATCHKNDKAKISKGIVAAVRERGGRFIQLNKNKKFYFDIGDKKAAEKTSQALREDLVPLRQTMMQEGYQRGSSGTCMNPAYDTSLLTSDNTARVPVSRSITPLEATKEISEEGTSSTARVPTPESATPPEATKAISEEGYFGYSVQVLEALENDSDVDLIDMKMAGIGGVDGAGRGEHTVIRAAGVVLAGGRSTFDTGTGTERSTACLGGGVGLDHLGGSGIDSISTPPETSTQLSYLAVPGRGVASSINQIILHPTNTDQIFGREKSWNSGSTEDSHVGVVHPGGSGIDSISTPPEPVPSTQSSYLAVPARGLASSTNQIILHSINTDELSGQDAPWNSRWTEDSHARVVHPGGSGIDSISTPPEPSTQSPYLAVPGRGVASSMNHIILHPTNTDQQAGREASLVSESKKDLQEAWLAILRLLNE